MIGRRSLSSSFAVMPGSLALAVLCSLASYGQTSSSLLAPEELAARLRQGDRDEQSRLASLLRLHTYDQRTGFTNCEVSVMRANLRPEGNTSLVQVRCGYNVDLIALEQGNGQWEWLDTVPLWAVYDRLTIEITGLVDPPAQEIVVHNSCTLHGTGLYYGHFLVLKLIAGRLRVIFNALEQGVEAPYDGPSREQSSTFKLTPRSGKNSATIEETAQYKFGRASYTIVRRSLWDDSLKTFLTEVISEVKRERETRK